MSCFDCSKEQEPVEVSVGVGGCTNFYCPKNLLTFTHSQNQSLTSNGRLQGIN